MKFSLYFRIFIVFLTALASASGHGRFVEPPSRASAWRFGFNTPRDYDDNEGFCGGKQHQHAINGGRCGLCGDAWDEFPRPHEVGGRFATGTIVRSYSPGTRIQASVEITANHKGYFEFRICPTNSSRVEATQDCLDRHPLLEAGSSQHRLYIGNENGVYNFELQLPRDLVCRHCVMQWRYVAGNDWGICPDGSGALGCGPQEEFRACADVSILPAGATSPPQVGTATPSFSTPPRAPGPQLTDVPSVTSHLANDGPQPTLAVATRPQARPPVVTDIIFGIPVTRVPERRACSAHGVWRDVAIMDSWCDANCNHEPPYCPTSHCICV